MTILDALEAAEKAATSGPWEMQIGSEGGGLYGDRFTFVEGVRENQGEYRWIFRFDDDFGTDPGKDAALIALLRNHAADLIAVARAAEATWKNDEDFFKLVAALAPLLATGEPSRTSSQGANQSPEESSPARSPQFGLGDSGSVPPNSEQTPASVMEKKA